MDTSSTGSDSDSAKLDEQLDDSLDEEISTVEKQLKNAEEPDELDIDGKLDPKQMEGFLEAIKKMPRGEAAKLIANLGMGQNIGNYDFSTVSDTSRLSTKEKMKLRLQQMQSKRQSKSAKATIEKRKEKKLKEDEEKKKADESTKPVDASPEKPSKSQKKRQKLKAKKLAKNESEAAEA